MGELLHDRRYPLKLKDAVYKSYVGPAIEACCLKERDWSFVKDRDIRGKSNVRSTGQKKC